MYRSATPAKVRVLHAFPKYPVYDIHVNHQPVLQKLALKQCSETFSLPPGQYRFDVMEGVKTALSAIIPIRSGMSYLLIITGKSTPRILQYTEDTFLPFGQAKIRLGHFSSDAPPIDLFLKTGEPLFSSVAFTELTAYLQVSPGVADFEIRASESEKPLLTSPRLHIEANRVYTFYTVDFLSKMELLYITN
ncbi:DUF4397 domain-containing protein [Ectobacillus sp. JY-23]|uniref:DUF4397 domain-containing protein n=1 Tax=Ectobacillus sp. JY-23 TaxID=2933872 RepID=UPI001FF65518|nr:DUF4397 domain-containing protein [Ectobacillus sp. JY-23]UOY92937.1 DUF4397 domain-containing protein [Ectobacillus sp. JY-23]